MQIIAIGTTFLKHLKNGFQKCFVEHLRLVIFLTKK